MGETARRRADCAGTARVCPPLATVDAMTIRRENTPAGIAVSGLVATPRELSLRDLHALAEVTDHASGKAVPVGALIDPAPAGRFVSFDSGDGLYRASVPVAEACNKGLLLVGRSSEGLDPSAGGPVRLVVPDGDTLCWNVKNVVELRVTTDKEPDSVPENPTH